MRRLKRLAKRKKGSNPSPWITKGILISISERDHLYKLYLREKTLSSRSSSRRQHQKNIATRLFRFSGFVENTFFTKYFSDNQKNIGKIWKGVKSIISLHSSSYSSPTCINIDNSPMSDPSIIATSFNDYFVSIAENIRKEIPFTNKHFTNFLKNPVSDSFFFSPTDELEVFYCLSSLDLSKSSGPFSIPGSILSLIKNELSAPLSNIINLSFTTGIFPTNLKTAKVIPVYKKESKLEVNNYRPISLLSNIDKVFEKLIYKHRFRSSHYDVMILHFVMSQCAEAIIEVDYRP